MYLAHSRAVSPTSFLRHSLSAPAVSTTPRRRRVCCAYGNSKRGAGDTRGNRDVSDTAYRVPTFACALQIRQSQLYARTYMRGTYRTMRAAYARLCPVRVAYGRVRRASWGDGSTCLVVISSGAGGRFKSAGG